MGHQGGEATFPATRGASFKLDQGVTNRPHINIHIGNNKRALVTPALVDTGASISVINKELAQQICTKEGRPYLLTKTHATVTSATGHGLQICGTLEAKVSGIGIVSFHVVQGLSNHSCIIGWDELQKHGFQLNKSEIRWGNTVFQLDPYTKQGIAEIHHTPHSPNLQKVIEKYKAVFGRPNQLQQAQVPPMEIKTTGYPIHQRAYRTPLAKREAIDKEIDKMLEQGIIRESSSEWASPVLLVPKKDGELRFCVDYRKVNDQTIKNRYPLPYIQDVFDQLGGAATFSTLDLRSGYHQVPLTPESIPKTAFVCHRGQYEYTRVPFGLCNAPGHFQSIMNKVLAKHIGKRVMVFLDDVVIYSKDPSQHATDLELVLQDIKAANLTLKESKCHFGRAELDLLGFVISAKGIQAQPSKTAAIKQLSIPTGVTELRRFLGMCSYYRQLVPKFAEMAEPLFQLTRKDKVWEWTQTENQAFERLKETLVSNQIMAHPNSQKPYILYTDACDYAIGGILCQEDEEGIERPIQYVSAQLTSTQRRWATVEKECWAVVYCLDKLRCYLLGSEFVVFTDHKPLLSLFTSQMKNTKIQRWGILFEEFGAKIRYRPGPNNVRADMLSRIDHKEIAVIDMSAEWVNLDHQMPDTDLTFHDDIDRDLLIRDQQVEFPEERCAATEPDSNYLLHEDILFSCARTNKYEPRYPRVVLPSSFRRQIIQRCHSEAGHAGTIKTMIVVQEGYVWPGMKSEIDTFIKTCPTCRVHIQRPDKVPMGDMPLANSPGQIIGVDLIGPMIPSHKDNKYVMVVIDHFSGWVEAYPLATKSNEAVWEKLRSDYFPRHGTCRVMITDQGAEFKSREWEEWLRGNRIEHRRTSPFHPQSNGRTERANRTIKEMLRKLVDGNRSDWEEKLGPALWAIRTNTSMTTGYSPFFLHHARPARAPISDMLNKEADYTLENRLAIQSEVFQAAARATKDSRKYNKARLEARATAKDIKVGDHVLLKANEPLSLTAKWDFGYVVSKVNGLVVELMHPETGAVIQTHREKIVLTDPDMAWDEISPRPRRQRQKVTQVHIPKRRDYIPRSRRNSVSSTVSQGSVRSASTVKSAATAPVKRQDTVFARPTALPPFSQNRLPKRPREDSYSEDFIAKRTRAQRQKRALEEDGVEEPEPKRWRSEQLSLLQFVSDYFFESHE